MAERGPRRADEMLWAVLDEMLALVLLPLLPIFAFITPVPEPETERAKNGQSDR